MSYDEIIAKAEVSDLNGFLTEPFILWKVGKAIKTFLYRKGLY